MDDKNQIKTIYIGLIYFGVLQCFAVAILLSWYRVLFA
jgi:hypothetical protein